MEDPDAMVEVDNQPSPCPRRPKITVGGDEEAAPRWDSSTRQCVPGKSPESDHLGPGHLREKVTMSLNPERESPPQRSGTHSSDKVDKGAAVPVEVVTGGATLLDCLESQTIVVAPQVSRGEFQSTKGKLTNLSPVLDVQPGIRQWKVRR